MITTEIRASQNKFIVCFSVFLYFLTIAMFCGSEKRILAFAKTIQSGLNASARLINTPCSANFSSNSVRMFSAFHGLL